MTRQMDFREIKGWGEKKSEAPSSCISFKKKKKKKKDDWPTDRQMELSKEIYFNSREWRP